MTPSRASIATDWGVFTAVFSPGGLAELHFPGATAAGVGQSAPINTAWIRQTEGALRRALAGKPPERLPPFAWPEKATPFQRAVWEGLLQIPAGEVRTYGELAAVIGRPMAARAVGQACGANPIPVLVPCHRVVAASGGLGGFSAGLDWKRRLLSVERSGGLSSQPR